MATKKTKSDALAEKALDENAVMMLADNGASLFKSLGAAINYNLAPAPAGGLLKVVRTWEKALEAAETALKTKLVAILKEQGQDAEEGTGKSLEVDGVRIAMHRSRTGYDPKRVEAILRAKGKEPADFMDATITYKVNEDKLLRAVSDGVFTAEELEAACRYPESWTLKTPEKAE